MKATFTHKIFSCASIAVVLLSMPFLSSAQTPTPTNLLTNSNFNSGYSAWNLLSTAVEVNIETTYGGTINTNIVAEVDAFTSLRQKMALIPGKAYTLSYKASRRTTGSTNANVAMDVLVSGDITGTVYVDFSKNYNNSTFGFVTETQAFVVPSNSIDKALIVEFVPRNNNTNRGVIVDDIEIIASASLPVQFISFTGELRNEQTVLNWKTAAETNNKYFVIERSANGNNYEPIGTVNAGTNNGVNSYSFTDAKLKAGTNFYRLRQVDADGAYKFSKVVIVRLQKGTDAIKVFPTIATSNINFNLSTVDATNAIVSIYDTNGKMMIRTQKSLTAGANQQGVDVSNLRSGAYYFRIQNNEGTINYTQAFQKY